jgi:PTH1 family peptidyl-tRNA hydrolase
MGWLQKRPQVSNPSMFYTVGLNKTVLLVGLGNPGSEYDLTRHNVGFLCLDGFVNSTSEMDNWVNKKDLKCSVSSGRVGDVKVVAVKPSTFMNLSGEAVQAVMNFYKIPLSDTVVLHDELDINFGQIRLRLGGSSAGHNGIKNISSLVGEEYNRVRIGVGPKSPARIKSEDFVLKKFTKEEQGQLNNLSKEMNAIISEFIFGGELPHETRTFLV